MAKTMKSDDSSSSLLSQLPEDIIYLILIKLSVKDLARLTYVSNLFKFLISNPYFLNLHLSITTCSNAKRNEDEDKKLSVAYLYKNNTMEFYCSSSSSMGRWWLCSKSPFIDLPNCHLNSFRALGSSGGLFCLYNKDSECNSYTLTLWNPLLSKSKKLPPLPYFHDFHTVPELHYPVPKFIPNSFRVVLGFSFHQATLDFKIVMILYDDPHGRPHKNGSYPAKVSVYSEKKKAWTSTITRVLLLAYILRCVHSVNLNGVAYWLARRGWHYDHNRRDDCIIGFDLDTEVFMDYTLQLPQDVMVQLRQLSRAEGNLRLFTLEEEDSLALFATEDVRITDNYSNRWTLWVLKIKNSSMADVGYWEKRYTLEMDQPFVPRSLVNATQVFVSFLGFGRVHSFIDVHTKHRKDLQDCGLPELLITSVTDYVPSLALLDT